MKVRADEHVCKYIVHMVCELAASPEIELSSVFDVGDDGTSDVHWITAFAKDGGEAIISADKGFFKKPHQVVAIDKTGLIVIYLPPKWANASAALQAAHIFMWWSRIEAKLSAARPREVWVAKWNISDKGELEKKKVDYASFHRKLKKAKRNSRREVQESRP